MTDHVYIEKNRVVNESTCKFYKRLLVGFIRHFCDQDDEVVIPELCFSDVSDNLGFHSYTTEGVDDNEEKLEVRVFSLTTNWKYEKDDCGGTQEPLDNGTISEIRKKTSSTHLRLIK